jgi:hypothetical protein
LSVTGNSFENGADGNSAAPEILGIIGKAPSISQAVLLAVTWRVGKELLVRADDTPQPIFLLDEIVCKSLAIGKISGRRIRLAGFCRQLLCRL